ncbi:MAG: hypothetical protein AAGD11_02520 [Planctomycetota bacterium]
MIHRMHLLSMIVCMIAPSGAHGQIIESWEFDDAAGTQLSDLAKAAGSSTFPFDNAHVTTDGQGALEFAQGANSTANVFRSATLTDPNRTSGLFALKWTYLEADLSGGDAADANVGFGLRDDGANADMFLLRLHKQGGTLRIQTRIGNVNTNWFDFGTSALSGGDTPLTLRAEADLDNDLLDIFYTLGAGAEQSVQDLAIPDLQLDSIRLVANTDTIDWGPTDVVTVDSLTLFTPTPPTAPITLEVNTTTGLLSMKNTSGATLDLDFYEITSQASLSGMGWNSLQSQDLPGFPAGDGIGNGWEILGLENPETDFDLDGTVLAADLDAWRNDYASTGNSDADGDGDSDGGDFLAWQQTLGEATQAGSSLLSEAFLLGSSALADGAELSLGNGFQVGAAEDLGFRVRLADGTVISGDVQYVSEGALQSIPEPASAMLMLVALSCMQTQRSRGQDDG